MHQCEIQVVYVPTTIEAIAFPREMLFLSVCLSFIVVATVGLVGLIVVFLLNPQKPVFDIQTIRLDAYQLNVYSNSTLFVSSVASLVLNASNPNKIGLRYSPSRL